MLLLFQHVTYNFLVGTNRKVQEDGKIEDVDKDREAKYNVTVQYITFLFMICIGNLKQIYLRFQKIIFVSLSNPSYCIVPNILLIELLVVEPNINATIELIYAI